MSESDSAKRQECVPQDISHPPRPSFVLNVGITGHRADQLTPRLESAARTRVELILGYIADIARQLHRDGSEWFSPDAPVLNLVSAIAEGADSICADIGVSRGFRLLVPLPFASEIYAQDFSNDAARAQYDGLRAKADILLELPGERAAESAAYSLAGGAVLAASDVLIAIWNGKGSGGRGGTGDVVATALSMGKPVIHIPLDVGEDIRLLWPGDGPAAGNWHSALEPPAATLDRPRLEQMLKMLLLPPDDPGELQTLRAFFAEREKLLLRRIEYPLLLALTGAKRLRQDAWIKTPYLQATRADWARFDDYRRGWIADDAFAMLEHGYAWADNLANRFSQTFLSGHVINFTFSALAVALALFGFLIGGQTKIFFVAAELLLIAVIVLNTRKGHAEAWQQRWLDYRQLAERLRPMRTLKLLSVARPPMVSASSRTGSRRWIDWYAGAIWRQLAMPAGRIDADRVAILSDLVADHEIRPEISYHENQIVRMSKVNHALHLFGSVCFIGTVLLCIGFLISTALLNDNAAKVTALYFTVATAVLPAFGTAAYSLRVQGEFAGSAARSAATTDALTLLLEELGAQPTLSRVAAIANAASSMTLVDLSEWRLTYQQRALEIPG